MGHGVPWDDDSGIPNFSRRPSGHWKSADRGGPGGDDLIWVVDDPGHQATSQQSVMFSIETSDVGGLLEGIGGGIANGAEAAFDWAANGWHSMWN